MSEPLLITPEIQQRLIGVALDGLASPHTLRAYRAALDEFLTWSQGHPPSVLCKALVHSYKAMILEKELAPATINLRLAAVRRLAQEAAVEMSSYGETGLGEQGYSTNLGHNSQRDFGAKRDRYRHFRQRAADGALASPLSEIAAYRPQSPSHAVGRCARYDHEGLSVPQKGTSAGRLM